MKGMEIIFITSHQIGLPVREQILNHTQPWPAEEVCISCNPLGIKSYVCDTILSKNNCNIKFFCHISDNIIHFRQYHNSFYHPIYFPTKLGVSWGQGSYGTYLWVPVPNNDKYTKGVQYVCQVVKWHNTLYLIIIKIL